MLQLTVELLMGLEPMASSLPRTRSTTELQQPDPRPSRRIGRIGLSSNRQAILFTERVKGIEPSQLAWKARALPLSYTRP